MFIYLIISGSICILFYINKKIQILKENKIVNLKQIINNLEYDRVNNLQLNPIEILTNDIAENRIRKLDKIV